jgi:3-methyladenine DNA glycosylase AlkD
MICSMPQSQPKLTPLADEIMGRLSRAFEGARDPERATPMAAYMRDQFPFLGIPSPTQKALTREVFAGLGRPAEPDLAAVALACWERPEREYQYFACSWLRRHARLCGQGFIVTARQLLVTKSWWDTVDALAAHLVGPLVAQHPALVATTDAWLTDHDRWLVRTAILHQLTFKEATDATRLFHYCTVQAAHPDFFVRKAIGWALREYAKTDPAAVRTFVNAHHSRLAVLSVREALKNLG